MWQDTQQFGLYCVNLVIFIFFYDDLRPLTLKVNKVHLLLAFCCLYKDACHGLVITMIIRRDVDLHL